MEKCKHKNKYFDKMKGFAVGRKVVQDRIRTICADCGEVLNIKEIFTAQKNIRKFYGRRD
jgi:hypothetical protein